MYTLLAQAGTPAADIGTYLQSMFQQAIGIDVMLAFKMLGLWVFIIWLVFALWVAVDASARYKQWQVAVLWFLFVLPFNVLGFVGYLFMRPPVTIDEHQWTKLESKYLMHELSSVNDCPTCGTLVPVSNNFCPVCGTQMNVTCAKCEATQSIYHIHCTNCGEKIGEEQKQVSKLKIVSHKQNIFQKIGEAVLGAKNGIAQKLVAIRSKVTLRRPKAPKEAVPEVTAVEATVEEKPAESTTEKTEKENTSTQEKS